jgi:hypothetical protein
MLVVVILDEDLTEKGYWDRWQQVYNIYWDLGLEIA